MGSKWLVSLTLLVLVQGALAEGPSKQKQKLNKTKDIDSYRETYRDVLQRCGVRDGEALKKEEPKDQALVNKPMVPMQEEISRRVRELRLRLRNTPLGTEEFITQYFTPKILEGSKMLQVDQNDQAELLRQVIDGAASSESGWRMLERAEAPKKDEHGRFLSGVATLQNEKNDIYQVSCVNLGEARNSHSWPSKKWMAEKEFYKDLSDDPICDIFKDLIDRESEVMRYKFSEQMFNEKFLYKNAKFAPAEDVYACFLNQSGT